jgi:uncharacterized protein
LPRIQRLTILGRAEIFEGEKAKAWMDKVHDSRYKATPERVYVIHLAFDWNCPQHIIPRFTEEEIREAVAPAEKRMQDLELENQKLRAEVAHLNNKNGN